MNKQHIGCISEILLLKAKEIFGAEIVINAWLYSETYSNEGKELFKTSLASLKEDFLMGKSDIDLSKGNVIIEFISGKKVQFSASEWGDIGTPEFKEFDKIFKAKLGDLER